MNNELQTSSDDLPSIGKIGARIAGKVLKDLAEGDSIDVICSRHSINKAQIGEIITSQPGREYLKKARAFNDLSLDGRMTKAVLLGTEKLLDRIEYGDVILLKGKLVRVPLSAKDLAFCISVLFDKRKQLQQVEAAVDIADGLSLIAQKLEQLGSAHVIEGKAIEPEVIEDAEILPSDVPATQRDILFKFNALEHDLAGHGREERTAQAMEKFNIINGL